MAKNDLCCTDETVIENPKQFSSRKGKDKFKMFRWLNDRNPIPEQIKDSEEVSNLFAKYPIIPYASTEVGTGHSLLKFFINLRTLSNTQGSCIKSQRDFCFGAKPKIKRLRDSNVDLEEDEKPVDASLKLRFNEFLNSINLKGLTFKALSKNLFDDYKTTGNAYFQLIITETFGIKAFTINYIEPEDCYYLSTKKGEVQTILVTPELSDKVLRDSEKTSILPVFPNFIDLGKGIKTSIVHIKSGTGKYYGRPDSINSFMSQYREYQNEEYLIKQADNGFVGQVLIEIEGDDPNIDTINGDADSFDSTVDRLEANFTNKAEDPLTIMFMERPYGAKEAFVKQFTPNTNENFFKVTDEIAKKKIIKSHSWSERFLGDSAIAKGFSDSVFMEELKAKLPLIQDYQEIIESPLNKVLTVFAKEAGLTELENLGLKFPLPFETIIKETKNLKE